jgi:hypothetical protein
MAKVLTLDDAPPLLAFMTTAKTCLQQMDVFGTISP